MPSRQISGPFHLLAKYHAVLLRTAAIEIRALYAGSALGALWVVLGPLLLLSLYAVVYVMIFRIQPATLSPGEYVLYVFAGLVPTIAFAMALAAGSNSLVQNKQVLLNTVFPAELLPLRAVLVQSVPLPVGLALVALAVLAVKGSLSAAALIVPLLVVLQIMFVAGIVWVLALLTLALRDIQQLLQYVALILLIVTPIAYTPDMIPASLRLLMHGNPLYYFTAAFQASLVYGVLPPLPILAGCMTLALVSFLAGYWLFRRVKMSFYDYA
jgi:lipopolysaccharide transport system permease protein